MLKETVSRLEGKADKARNNLEDGIVAAPQVLVDVHRRRLRATNTAERLNEEIRRRERVIQIFPNEDSATRLTGVSGLLGTT